MGLIKLAIIGGAAYYAGKKLNEPHYDAQGNIIHDPRQAYHGGWCQRKRWHEQQQQQQQRQQSNSSQDVTRDNPFQDYPEKPSTSQNQQPNQYQQRQQQSEFPSTYYNDYPPNDQKTYAFYHPDPSSHQTSHDIKPRSQSPVQTKQIIRYDSTEVPSTPPAYAGFSIRPPSPQSQQRAYMGANGNAMGMIDNMPVSRSESAPPVSIPVQVQQAQRMYQNQSQMGAVSGQDDQKKGWSVDKLMWK